MSEHHIDILRMTHLRGPSIWTYRPVIEALVDIGELEDRPSNTLPGFNERLTAWLPGLVEHRCSVGQRGGFLLRLRDGTWPAHIMEHVALELQTRAGMQTGFGKAREAGPRGIYKVAIRTRHEAVGKAALTAARDLIEAAIDDRPYDVAATIERLKDMVDRLCLGPSTACIVDAASERGIPSVRLNDGNLVQLGHGANQRRIWTAETDRTSAIAEGISRDKDLTKELLAQCGVPVPSGQTVDSAAAAWEAAQDFDGPVVVKPTDGNHGRAVTLNLTERADIEAAYAAAEAEGSGVMVERFIPGSEHRLLVVGGRVVAATRGEITQVRGDGQSSVMQLIDAQLNTDPRRGPEESFPLDTIRLPENINVMMELTRQGLTPESVPALGQSVVVERTGNLTHDVTDEVHPDVAADAALAARIVGLDIAGVDLVTTDIGRPLHETGGAIVEVNAGPGLLMHLKPGEGQPRPVGQAIAQHLLPAPNNGRIPLIGVLGGASTTAVAHLISALLRMEGRIVGLACADGLYLGERRLEHTDARDYEHGERVLMNQSVRAAVIETSARHILDEGLPYDRCLIGVVTGMPHADGLADHYIERAEQMPYIARTQIDVVLPNGCAVLNADDAACAALAPHCDGAVLMYSRGAFAPALHTNRAAGGRVVFARAGSIWLAHGENEAPLIDLDALNLPKLAEAAGTAPDPADRADALGAVLAAVGAVWSLGMAPDMIRAGLYYLSDAATPALAA